MIVVELLYTLIPTIVIELGVLLLLKEKRKKVLLSSVVINILTNVPLNIFLRLIDGYGWIEIIIGEIIVLIVETLWYWWFVKNFKKAFIYSFLCNAMSFLIGVLFQLIVIYLKY